MQIKQSPVNLDAVKTSQVAAMQTNGQAVPENPANGPEDVTASVENVQKKLDIMKDLSFQVEYNEDIDRVIVKYRNRDTGEVVSQIPSEKFVEFEKEFVKTIGMLFDRKV